MSIIFGKGANASTFTPCANSTKAAKAIARSSATPTYIQIAVVHATDVVACISDDAHHGITVHPCGNIITIDSRDMVRVCSALSFLEATYAYL